MKKREPNRCSWSDMARIQAMLKNPDKYGAELASMKRCVSRSTLTAWNRALEGRKHVHLSAHSHVAPTHVREITRAIKDETEREAWVNKCEDEKLTVKALRQLLLAAKIKKSKPSHSQPKINLASANDFLETVDDESIDLLLTDPPYSTDVDDIDNFSNWLPLALKKLKPSARAYVFIGAYPKELFAYLSAAMPRQVLTWAYRNTIGPSPSHDYKLNWQAILYFAGDDAPPLDCPVMLEQFAAREISAPDGRQPDGRWHAWEKPLELAESFIRHSTKEGDTILDLFAGTGTFPLAAAKLGRAVMACEANIEMANLAEMRGCQIEK